MAGYVFATCVQDYFSENVGFRSEGHSYAKPHHKTTIGDQRWEAEDGGGRGRKATVYNLLFYV